MWYTVARLAVCENLPRAIEKAIGGLRVPRHRPPAWAPRILSIKCGHRGIPASRQFLEKHRSSRLGARSPTTGPL